MSRSIRVRPNLVWRVKLAVKHNGFLRQKDLAEDSGLADSTVRNFLNGKPVDHATFGEICHRLNLEWRDFADLGEIAEPHQESGAAIDVSANELNSEQGVLEQSQPSHPLQGKKENTLEASHPIGAISFLEYFSKAIDQLKSKDLDVRIGAISTLGTLAKYSQPAEHWKIMEYLTVFIRTNAPRKEEEEEQWRNIPLDVQEALKVIAQRDSTKDVPNQKLDLSDTDIREVKLREADLKGVDLNGANLQGAILYQANLQGAIFSQANLQGASLTQANLQEAILYQTNLQGVSLLGAELQKADLREANLQGASLTQANLHRANLALANLQWASLMEANLQDTILMEANLSRANLSGAIKLELQQIIDTSGDSKTVLPDNIKAPKHWT